MCNTGSDDELFQRSFPALADWECNALPDSCHRSLNYLVSFRSCGEIPKTQTERSYRDKMITPSRLLVGRAIKKTAMKPPPKLSTLHHKQTGGHLRRNISTQCDFSHHKATETDRPKKHTRTSKKYKQSDKR